MATGVIVSVRCEKKGPIETEELEHFDDDDIDKAQELAQSIRSVIAAELQAAHDAGVVEGKAGERALEMFVVRSLAHEVDGGDDKTAEQLIEMLLAERDAARSAGVAERNAEVATLRQIISDAAREVGAQVSPECSLEFMALLPREIALALRRAEGGR